MYLVSMPIYLMAMYTTGLTLYGAVFGYNKRLLIQLLRLNFSGNFAMFMVNNVSACFLVILVDDYKLDKFERTKEIAYETA